MWNHRDLEQMNEMGLTPGLVEQQLEHFVKGFPYVQLEVPASPGNGILKPGHQQLKALAAHYDSQLRSLDVVKFVPASGAATRMFAHIFSFADECRKRGNLFSGEETSPAVSLTLALLQRLSDAPFYDSLCRLPGIAGAVSQGRWDVVTDAILGESGLNYGALPKALIDFHRYEQGSRKAAEEHLVEAALYAATPGGIARLHFTLSPEHIGKFNELMERVVPEYSKMFNVQYEISVSIQKSSTDTIAADEYNRPFRNADGSLLFRPAGHGALLSNLNDIDADLVFIKNIDNVVPDRLKGETVMYKKAIAGYLLQVRAEVFRFVRQLEPVECSRKIIQQAEHFARSVFCHVFDAGYFSLPDSAKAEILSKLFRRPIRICGMVKNAGEPGGGPFFVRGTDGRLGLQIVESSQVDMGNPVRKECFMSATHFNPVDLVCSFRKPEGGRYHLPDFSDPETGFISVKSKDGRALKAQELPGLWNGAMARWNTIFVEVPLITFNPVKTVNDLLRPEHLG